MSSEAAVVQHQQPATTTHSGQVATMNPARMIELAIEKGAVEQLDKLLELQERWEANEARKAFVEALTEFNQNKPEIQKNKHVEFETRNNGLTAYDHASLDHICEILGEALGRVGIAFRWSTLNLPNGWIRVTCILTHRQGHSEETTLEGPHDQSGGKNPIQAIGSTTEYLRRYTLLAATGVAVKGMDDDGQGGNQPDPRVQQAAEQRKQNAPQGQQKTAQGMINGNQREALQKAIEKAGQTTEQFCRSAGIPSLDQLTADRFKGAMQHLNAMKQRSAQQ